MLPFKVGLSADGQTVTLHKLGPIESAINYVDAADRPTLNVILLDTETTGLTAEDEMVEIGIAAFKATTDGYFTHYFKTKSWLNEPGRPMHPEAELVTGLSMEKLKGERFDDAEIEKVLEWADVIVAHNARYDYQKMHMRYSRVLRDKMWLCSFAQVAWLSHGHDSGKLSTLAYEHGFFYEKHRTDGDIHAMARLLSYEYAPGKTYFGELLSHQTDELQIMLVTKSPFVCKDIWRPRGYFWHPMKKTWWSLKSKAEIAIEKAFLEGELADRYPRELQFQVEDVPPTKCFDPMLVESFLR